jgi:Tfp pilus assembly protein PilF
VTLVLTLGTSLAHAAKDDTKTRKVQAVREIAGKRLSTAYEALKENDYAAALEAMDALKKKSSLNDHERALMWQTYGYIQSSQDDYKAATISFQKCVELNALPLAAHQSTIYNLAQLYLALEDYDRALKTLKLWFSQETNPKAAAYYMLGIAYVQSGDLEKALEPSLTAIRKSNAPKEPWLQLAMSLQFERKNYRAVVGILEQLLARYPKKSYWTQLSGVYGELEEDENALAALEVAYSQEMLTKERELIGLARMYLYHQVPYRAARVVERGIEDGTIKPTLESWELLANSWLHAREYDKGIGPLGKAAKLSEDGKLFERLGQVHLEREEWPEAEKAFTTALKRGDLSNEGSTRLLLGIALASANKKAEARKAFQLAKKHPKTKKAATQWLEHLDR